jgi:hypothetical protein
MQARITKRVVDAAHPQSATYLIRGTEIKGFVLVVTPASSKSYAIDYRAGSGRGAPKRRFVIGKHGALTPEVARGEARRLLGAVAAGGDPASARSAARRALTISELCDLYVTEGAAHKKASTLKSDRGRIKLFASSNGCGRGSSPLDGVVLNVAKGADPAVVGTADRARLQTVTRPRPARGAIINSGR